MSTRPRQVYVTIYLTYLTLPRQVYVTIIFHMNDNLGERYGRVRGEVGTGKILDNGRYPYRSREFIALHCIALLPYNNTIWLNLAILIWAYQTL